MENKITLDPIKLDVVLLNEVRPNSWNPKDKDTKDFEGVKASIEANGLRGFIVVRENANDVSKFEIIDGEQRWRACKELGFEKVIIYNEGIVSDKEAKELTIWWQVQVPFNELSLAKLITSMMNEFGSINTQFSEKKITEMQELANFSFDQYKSLDSTLPNLEPTEMLKTFMMQLTESQYDVVMQAISKAKKAADNEITDSKALEFVAIEYINMPDGQ